MFLVVQFLCPVAHFWCLVVQFLGSLFSFASSFSPGVSVWFSRFFHIGLDDNERERDIYIYRERERNIACAFALNDTWLR